LRDAATTGSLVFCLFVFFVVILGASTTHKPYSKRGNNERTTP
jgi:hypothetical protein